MTLRVKTQGRPIAIRQERLNGEYVFCFDFKEPFTTCIPNGMPNQEEITSTYMFNKKQWYTLLRELSKIDKSLKDLNELRLYGNLTLYISDSISIGDITVIVQDFHYIPYSVQKPNSSPIQLLIDPSYLTFFDHKKRTSLAKELHTQYDGQCQKCGQRCDYRSMRIKNYGSDNILLCLLCFCNRPMPEITATKQLTKVIAKLLKLSMKNTQDVLNQFPKKYAFVGNSLQKLIYWAWDQDNPILLMEVSNNGLVNSITPRNHILYNNAEKNYIDIIDNRITYADLSDLRFVKKQRINILVDQICISDQFLKKKPDPLKIQRSKNYYTHHNNSSRLPLIVQKANGLHLIDGYTLYIAAQELNIAEIECWIIKEK